MNKEIILFFSLLTKITLINKNNDSYIYNFLLMFGTSYYLINNFKLSLAITLLYFLALTFIKYMNFNKNINIGLYVIFLLICYNINDYKWIIQNVELILYCCITYILLSFSEWIVHKYIMHCNKQSFIYHIISFFDPAKIIEETCDTHIQHHMEVKPDMNLKEVKYKKSLFMGWEIFIYLFFINLAILIISRYISNVKINKYYLIIQSAILVFLWSYLWNKVHPLMHNYNGEYTIKEGPYENIISFKEINKLFYRNHQYHHLQKGHTKGNYNIIVFGADEWLNTNVKIVNNIEYCNNSKVLNEEICKDIKN